jgi:O-antigen/teichoic acid export membrane protein
MDIVKASTKLFVSRIGGSLVTFLGVVFFARELGTAKLGSFFLFQTLLIAVAVITDFGIKNAMIKRMSEGNNPAEFLGGTLLLKLPLVFVASIGLVAFANPIRSYVGFDATWYLMAGIALREGAFVTMKALEGELRVAEATGIEFIGKVAWVAVGVMLLRSGFGVQGLVYALFVRFSLMLALGSVRLRIWPKLPRYKQVQSLFNYAKYNMVTYISGYFYNWADTLVLGLFLGSAAVGAYEVAWRVSRIFMMLGSAIATALFPQISLWHSNQEMERISRAMSRAIVPAVFFIVPGLVGAIIVGPSLLKLVYGPEYVIASIALVVLVADSITNSVHSVLKHSLNAIDRPDLSAKSALVAMASNLVLNLILVWQIGLVGAAVATLFASLVNMLLHYLFLSRRFDLCLAYRDITWCVVSATVMGIVLVWTPLGSGIDSTLELLVVISASATTYVTFTMFSTSLREQMFTLAKSLL